MHLVIQKPIPYQILVFVAANTHFGFRSEKKHVIYFEVKSR